MSSDRLALLGGIPANPDPLPPYNTIGDAEKAAVAEVLANGELSGFVAWSGEEFWGGRQVRALEREICDYFGVKRAVAVNSATSALHCAVAATGTGPGDEVIVPPYTMSASATAILMSGAVPVFADIDADTFCLDPVSAEAAITPQTRGIMAVNLFGHPAPLLRLREIADRHGLFLIEDNAQAPGARCHGRFTGTIGDMGVLSFNRHKTMQCGEGGILITNDETLALKAALVRNHGEVVAEGLGITDFVNAVGLNYRMTEMEAAVARVQFGRIEELTEPRVALAKRLDAGLKSLSGITPPAIAPGCTHVYYFYAMKYDAAETGIPRELFAEAVRAEGFPLRAGYVRPIYLEPLYQRKICFGRNGFPFTANPRNAELSYAKGLCPVTERLQEREILITNIIYPPLTGSHMDLFVSTCAKVLGNRDALLRSVRG